MTQSAARAIREYAMRGPVYRDTVGYLCSQLRRFLRSGERVLICAEDRSEFGMGTLVAKAVLEAEGIPEFWGPDHRWQALLRQAFTSRASAIVGTPLMILGLAKLAKATDTPLFIRNVLLAGAPSERWMTEGIREALDARVWGCYDPIPGLVVSGFSCEEELGVHLRRDAVGIRLLDGNGADAAPGVPGRIFLSLAGDPKNGYDTRTRGRFLAEPCPCGCRDVRLADFRLCRNEEDPLGGLCEQLLSWSSVLDYRAEKREHGLFLEVVIFPGQRLPRLPSFAAGCVRSWSPREDVPFCLQK